MSENRPSMVAIGWIAFAGSMLVLAGVFQAIAGLVAIVDDDFYVVGSKYVFEFDNTKWGWIHLILGIVVVCAGVGCFSGRMLGRIVGVIVAVISAIVMFSWLPYYPGWAIVIIFVDISVIWALTVHGRDVAAAE